MAPSRRSPGSILLHRIVGWVAVPAAAVVAIGVVSLPAGAAVTDHNPVGQAGVAAGPPAHRARPATTAVSGLPQPLTRNSRTVRRANGSYTTTIYPDSVNYRTAAGWAPIDSSLVAAEQTGFAWRNKANRFTASFARHAGGGYLRVRTAGGTFDFDAKGAAGSPAAVRGSHLAYAAAYPGADLTYDVG